jgi:hypothetical protein
MIDPRADRETSRPRSYCCCYCYSSCSSCCSSSSARYSSGVVKAPFCCCNCGSRVSSSGSSGYSSCSSNGSSNGGSSRCRIDFSASLSKRLPPLFLCPAVHSSWPKKHDLCCYCSSSNIFSSSSSSLVQEMQRSDTLPILADGHEKFITFFVTLSIRNLTNMIKLPCGGPAPRWLICCPWDTQWLGATNRVKIMALG